MDKENLKLYIDLMNRYDELHKINLTMMFSNEDKILITNMRNIAIKDPKANEFLNSLTSMTPDEREIAVNNYFAKEDGTGLLITLDDVKNYKEEIASKSKEEQNKLNYYINHFAELNIKYIRLDDLKYITNDGEIEDIDLEKTIVKFEPKKIEEKVEEVEEPKIKKKTIKQAGYISAFLLFALTAVTGMIVATILTLVIK